MNTRPNSSPPSVTTTNTLAELLREATARFSFDSARLDAEILLSHVLQKPRSHLFAWPEKIPTVEQYTRFVALTEQRASGQPIAYLTSHKEFWSLDLHITADVLIPRPETELLVTLALQRLPNTHALVADLGTGSGAIALALASERSEWNMVATDASRKALEVARSNAKRLGLAITFTHGNWCSALPPQQYDLIISNPPYIANNDPHLKHGDVCFEPEQALSSGPTGLTDLQTIVNTAPAFLKPGAWLLLEHGYNQQRDVTHLLQHAGYQAIETQRDLAGHPRVTSGKTAE